MKKPFLLPSILFVLVVFLTSNIIEVDNSFTARINTYKYECKQMIKPYRYEGSRVTLYNGTKESTTKSIDAYLILDTDYNFAFSGKECDSKVSVKIYESENKRALLKEISNIKGKNVLINSKDLIHNFRKKVSNTERIKSVFIEYSITEGNDKNEAIVLVIGYKD